jgi:hypothetical protein
VSKQEPVEALPDLAHERAVLIELEEARAAVREHPRVAERRGWIAGPGVHKEMPGGVGGHARRFAEMDVGRHLENEAWGRVVRNLGDPRLGPHAGCERQGRRGGEQMDEPCHEASYRSLALDG